LTDKKLIQKAIKGDQKSIKKLYDNNVNEMFNASFRITNDVHLSEDIFQESFITSIQKLASLSDTSNYQGWLRRIVINKSLSQIRRKRDFHEVDSNISVEQSEDEKWYLHIPLDAIKKAIQALPARSRTVFSLYAIEGYKHREIANLLDISEATSKTQYRYAKHLLKTKLTKKYSHEI